MTRRRAAAAVAGALLATAPAACGGGSANALSGLGPEQAVQRAVEQLTRTSYLAEGTSTIVVDLSSLPAQVQQTLGGGRRTQQQSSTLEVASSRRMRVSLSTPARSNVHLVLYDGTIYISPDGTGWAEAPPAYASVVDSLTSHQVEAYAQHLSGVRDDGPVVDGGTDAERYSATVDTAFMSELTRTVLRSVVSAVGASAAVADRVASAMHLDAPTLTFVVARSTGRLVRETSHDTGVLDLAAMVRALGGTAPVSGSAPMRLTTDTTLHAHDYGRRVTVTRPASSGTLTLRDLERLLGGATGP